MYIFTCIYFVIFLLMCMYFKHVLMFLIVAVFYMYIQICMSMYGLFTVCTLTSVTSNVSGKFCNLLARLPELTRLCVVGKDQLTQRQLAGDVPQYSLLSELLKGDAAIAWSILTNDRFPTRPAHIFGILHVFCCCCWTSGFLTTHSHCNVHIIIYIYYWKIINILALVDCNDLFKSEILNNKRNTERSVNLWEVCYLGLCTFYFHISKWCLEDNISLYLHSICRCQFGRRVLWQYLCSELSIEFTLCDTGEKPLMFSPQSVTIR